jgi:arylsulfatase
MSVRSPLFNGTCRQDLLGQLLHKIAPRIIVSAVPILSILLVLPAYSAEIARRPNIILILADDLGFSDIGCYGGEIHTPNLDALALGGVRFTQFYNTARCWSTRSAILTGYYPQEIRMDPHTRGTPAPEWMRVIPHYLAPLGYRSYHSGKWHLNVMPKALAEAGFDRSYMLTDQNRYFSPRVHSEDDRPLPAVEPGGDYYATTAIAEHAIGCLREHADKYSTQPFFHYLAFTAPHFPLHAPESDIARYRDRYLEGWDAVREQRWQRLREMGIVNCDLAPLDVDFLPRYFKPEVMQTLGPGEVEHPLPWAQLSDEQKRFQATKMAIHAAMVDRMDQEIGRVLDQVRAMGALENTIIFFLSDNGADATIMVRGDGHDQAASPGSAQSHLCLGPGWASASNAPFRRHKIWVNEGGISTPLIVHWPRGIAAGGQLRHTPGHVIDFVPTLIELSGAKPTDTWHGARAPQLPGRSLVPALAADAAIERDYLFFHHEGNRAIRVGDWKLVSAHEDHDRWELFDLARDRCEKNDLAAAHPQLVQQLTDRWQQCETEFQEIAAAGLPPASEARRKPPAAGD